MSEPAPRVPGDRQARGSALPRVSFECFPPRDEKMKGLLAEAAERLSPMGPAFFSVTCSRAEPALTLDTVGDMNRGGTHPVIPHLTCAGLDHAGLEHLLEQYDRMGVRRVLALRGDIPEDNAGAARDFERAVDLVAAIRRLSDVEITVAAYPEVHPEAASPEADMDNLKRKLDAGASTAITQFFFDSDVFLRYRDQCQAAGVEVPVVPGILPVRRFKPAARFAAKCGTHVPEDVAKLFRGLEDDPDSEQLVGLGVALDQCRRLHAAGVDEFHFYTLNRAEPTLALCRLLGLGDAGASPGEDARAAA